MARYEEKFPAWPEAAAYLEGLINPDSANYEVVKKIDLRSYQGGYKVIVKTFDKKD